MEDSEAVGMGIGEKWKLGLQSSGDAFLRFPLSYSTLVYPIFPDAISSRGVVSLVLKPFSTGSDAIRAGIRRMMWDDGRDDES